MRKLLLFLTFILALTIFSTHVNATDNLTIMGATLPFPLYNTACASSNDGNIFCFGGTLGGSASSDQILEYQVDSDLISIRNILSAGISETACVRFTTTNNIYCFGGNNINAGIYYPQILGYDISINSFFYRSSLLPSGRRKMACAESSYFNKIYCFGGEDRNGVLSDIIEYEPVTDTIHLLSVTLPSSRGEMSCAENSASHLIYCFGGESSSSELNQILEFNPFNQTIQIKNSVLPTIRRGLSCAENSGSHSIYCFGGVSNGITTDQILEYTTSDTILIRPVTLPTARTSSSCTESSISHKFYCFGGQSPVLNQIISYINNGPPQLNAIENQNVSENTPLVIQLQATDPDNDPITFSTNAQNVLLTSFDFNETSGLFTWTPGYHDQGQYNVTFSVTDGIYTVSETITITVLDVPRHEIEVEGTPHIGGSINITSLDSASPNAFYFLIFSFGDQPGITLSDNRHIGLNPDGLFIASLYYPLLINLFGSQGHLDQNGESQAIFMILNEPALIGLDIYMAFVTFDPLQPMPESILNISRTQKITLVT